MAEEVQTPLMEDAESGEAVPPVEVPAAPEEKAVIDLVVLGERFRQYWEPVVNFIRAKYYHWSPVIREHSAAWFGILKQQISKQYHLFNLKTRPYKYRTFVAVTLVVLLMFFLVDSLFFATRIDPPKAPMAQKLPPPPPPVNLVPEVAKSPWTQQQDAKQHKHLLERTPGLGSREKQEQTGELKVDAYNPASIAKLLSKMVEKDANLLHYFRGVLNKHDSNRQDTVTQNDVINEENEEEEDKEEEEEETDTMQRGGKRIIPDDTLTSQQLLLKAWSKKRQEEEDEKQQREQNEGEATSESGEEIIPQKVVNFENPYLLGDLGAAQMNLPHIKNISEYISQIAAFTERLNKVKVPADDVQLVNLAKNYWIRKPSKLPYDLEKPDQEDTSMGQAAVVDEILRHKRNGFFVECGALDGETRSNTLFFERHRNWTGLLIEPGPVNYRRMVKKHRKAFISPACLGVDSYPSRKYFHRGKNRGRLLDAEDSVQWVADQYMILDRTGVQCLPLYTLLLALNQTHVDYFSLDVEGVELEVLKSIPFHLLDIDVISVEYAHGRATKEELKDYVTQVIGYRVVYEVSRKDWLANDFILVREDLIS